MEPNLSPAETSLQNANAAYLQSVRDAERTGHWHLVSPAKHAVDHARAAMLAERDVMA